MALRAADVDADLVLCGINTFMLIPDFIKVAFTQCDKVSLAIALCGVVEQIKVL